MQSTIIDIARYAGVSKSTVSRVLNESGPTSAMTRRKVLEAVEMLNFKPNAVARHLARNRSNSFSLIVQDIRNPYYAYASWYAERILSGFGFSLDILNADNNRSLEKSALETVKYRRVDGLLCIGGDKDATNIIDFHVREGIPVVLVDREVQGYDIPTVNLDNVFGARLATDYLFDLGHRRIVFATSDLTLPERHRMEGFILSCQAKGLAQEDIPVVSMSEDAWAEGGFAAFEDVFHSADPPTAFFGSNDIKALRLIRLLRRKGYSVPEDISVIGYDDIDISSIVVPSLTTIHQPINEMIEAGTSMLMDLVEGREPISSREIAKPWLVERESTRSIRQARC
jgi:DNA-binding LacI/PurR family transcriptional regulator